MDLSHLDTKYFIDAHKYNCPYCKRNHVSYDLVNTHAFDWTDKKICHVHFVRCNSCQKTSLHFTFNEIRAMNVYGTPTNSFKNDIDIDKNLFYSQPSSFFTIDDRLPKDIRDLIFEAEKSRQANLLIGASACLRKAIYELLEHEEVIVKNPKTGHANYQDSIKALKAKFSNIAPELFDGLGDIQELASDNVHEGSWDAWDAPKLRILIELTKATLHEMYVVPQERKDRLGVLNQLKYVFSNSKNGKEATEGVVEAAKPE